MSDHILHLGDCLEVMRTMPDCSVDAVVTDPPYGLSFMGKAWDYDVPSVDVWREVLRVLKPGGHLLAFAGTRTQHRMAVAIEDAGFEIRDMIAWVYGSGFPKSLDVSKAIDKAAGARGHDGHGFNAAGIGSSNGGSKFRSDHPDYVKPQMITPEAQQWDGWGTALKPALEPITMARKPFNGTVAANVLEHGTGALNVDGCRIDAAGEDFGSLPNRAWQTGGKTYAEAGHNHRDGSNAAAVEKLKTLGRWPANLIHDGSDNVVNLFPDARSSCGGGNRLAGESWFGNGADGGRSQQYYDSGSAARFFYTAKATRAERQGCTHPTVKPLDLMAYLCRLVTPPAGTVLDPFMGSGTTIKAALSEGFNAIGIEREPSYFAMAEHRMNGAQLGLGLDL